MRYPSILTLVSTCVVCAALVGCEDAADCPAPIAEPAATAAVSATAPRATAPAAAPQATTAPAAAQAAIPTRTEPVRTGSTDPTNHEEDLDCDANPACDLDADLYVKRLVIARGVSDREPVKSGETFAVSQGKRLYAFVEVGNRSGSASEVFVSFKPVAGKDKGRVRLSVGASPRWRTWAYTELATAPGEWEAIVRNARGDVIGTQKFLVTEKPEVLEADPYAEDAVPAAHLPAKATDDNAAG